MLTSRQKSDSVGTNAEKDEMTPNMSSPTNDLIPPKTTCHLVLFFNFCIFALLPLYNIADASSPEKQMSPTHN